MTIGNRSSSNHDSETVQPTDLQCAKFMQTKYYQIIYFSSLQFLYFHLYSFQGFIIILSNHSGVYVYGSSNYFLNALKKKKDWF